MASRATSQTYRFVLALFACILVSVCAYLSLVLRAVSGRDQWAVLLAGLYGFLFACLVTPPPEPVDTRPQSQQGSVPPLAAPGSMRTQAIALLCISAFLSIGIPVAWLVTLPPKRQETLLAPHLFIMCAQVVFELLTYRRGTSLLIRLAVPVLATAYRLRLLAEWVTASERLLERVGTSATLGDKFMRVLAVANLMFWVAVLFIFLLLKVVPRYFAPSKTAAIALQKAVESDAGDLIFPSPNVRDASACALRPTR